MFRITETAYFFIVSAIHGNFTEPVVLFSSKTILVAVSLTLLASRCTPIDIPQLDTFYSISPLRLCLRRKRCFSNMAATQKGNSLKYSVRPVSDCHSPQTKELIRCTCPNSRTEVYPSRSFGREIKRISLIIHLAEARSREKRGERAGEREER